MTTYIWDKRIGKVVEKSSEPPNPTRSTAFPMPMLGASLDEYKSETSGKVISNQRERIKDMDAAGCVDPSDITPYVQKKKETGLSVADRKTAVRDAFTQAERSL